MTAMISATRSSDVTETTISVGRWSAFTGWERDVDTDGVLILGETVPVQKNTNEAVMNLLVTAAVSATAGEEEAV